MALTRRPARGDREPVLAAAPARIALAAGCAAAGALAGALAGGRVLAIGVLAVLVAAGNGYAKSYSP